MAQNHKMSTIYLVSNTLYTTHHPYFIRWTIYEHSWPQYFSNTCIFCTIMPIAQPVFFFLYNNHNFFQKTV